MRLCLPSLLAGEDYTALAIGLQLNGSQRMTCFNVSTLENEKPEHSQDFTIQVDVNSPASIRLLEIGPDVLTVKILDDDGKTSQCIRPRIAQHTPNINHGMYNCQ